jgi:hypothetical protein
MDVADRPVPVTVSFVYREHQVPDLPDRLIDFVDGAVAPLRRRAVTDQHQREVEVQPGRE